MHAPAERIRASVALSTERAPNHLLVSAPLRPSNASNHTLSLLSENPTGFPDIILIGAQRDRCINWNSMKKKFDYILIVVVCMLIAIDLIGQKNVYTYLLRLYNGTEVLKKDYSVELPSNWAIRGNYENNQSTRIVGHLSDGSDTNIFLIDLYEYGFAQKNLLTKWTQCDHQSWYPIETTEGKKLALFLCTFDFNTTTEQNPSLTLNDADGYIIAAAHDWKPYYNEEYLDVFKSIKFNKNSTIKEISK